MESVGLPETFLTETAAPRRRFKGNVRVLMSDVCSEMSSKPRQQYGHCKHLCHLILHTQDQTEKQRETNTNHDVTGRRPPDREASI